MSYCAAVITVSDLGSRGLRQDTNGPAVCARLEEAGFSVAYTAIVPDEKEEISALPRDCADERKIDLIVNLPGSERAARENLGAVVGALEHGLHMIAAEGHDASPHG